MEIVSTGELVTNNNDRSTNKGEGKMKKKWTKSQRSIDYESECVILNALRARCWFQWLPFRFVHNYAHIGSDIVANILISSQNGAFDRSRISNIELRNSENEYE